MSFTDKMLGVVDSATRYGKAKKQDQQTLAANEMASKVSKARIEYLEQKTELAKNNAKFIKARTSEQRRLTRELRQTQEQRNNQVLAKTAEANSRAKKREAESKLINNRAEYIKKSTEALNQNTSEEKKEGE